MSNETIARRYAIALADVVIKSNEAETVKSELADWKALFASSDDLLTVVANPSVSHASKEKVLESLIAKASPSRTTANFLRVLLQNGRLGEVGEISDRFDAELDVRSGMVAAEITSARSLPEAERAAFQQNLEKLTGKKVNINYEIDTDIIGGVITRIGSTVYDASVKTKLENLREQLVNG